jgi:hypothetical protein
LKELENETMRLPVLFATLFLATGLFAQEREAVLIPVKTLSGDSFDRLVKMLAVFDVSMRADDKLRTILVYAPPNKIAEIRKVVEQLDQPGSEAAIGRNIDMTLTLLRCSNKAPAETHALPADLEAVARQLRAVTAYKDIQVWDTIPLHLQEGRQTESSSRLPNLTANAPSPSILQVRIIPESVSRRGSDRYVRFSRLNLGFKFPATTMGTNFTFIDVGLNTAGDFKEGQKAVIGKVGGVDDETGVFAVIALKVLD